MKEGENKIGIELVGTLRNLLGPHHRRIGESGNTWLRDFSGQWNEQISKLELDWYRKRRGVRSCFVDEYALVPFGFDTMPKIRIES